MTFSAVLLVTAVLSVCGRPEWDRHPDACLSAAGTSAGYSYFSGKVAEFASVAGVARPVVRPTVLLIRARSAEVERLPDGRHEVRVDADDLSRPRRVLRYVAAHEVCHIVNGDTERGVWAQLTQAKRDEMHRWVEACAYDLIGDAAYGEYLNAICGTDLPKHLAVLLAVRRDAEIWKEMRRQAHAAVP